MASKKMYADLHCHPSLRSFNLNEQNIWHDEHPKEKEREDFIQRHSQSELAGIARGRLRLVFHSIYHVEQGFVTNLLRDDLEIFNEEDSRKKTEEKLSQVADNILERIKDQLEDYLNDSVTAKFIITRLLLRILNRRKLKEIMDPKYDYFTGLVEEYEYLRTDIEQEGKVKIDGKNRTFEAEIATSYEDIKDELDIDDNFNYNSDEDNTIMLVLSIEGGHALGCGLAKTSNVSIAELDDLNNPKTQALLMKLKANIKMVKNWGKEEVGEHCPFYITLSHHFWNQLCGHSMSFAKVMHKLFNQDIGMSHGFTEVGKEVVKALLNNKNERRILIDIKHLSVKGRKWYLDYVKAHNDANPQDNIPIIASHVAVNGRPSLYTYQETGEDHDAWDKKYEQTVLFNNWEINLFDDEILRICESRGVMGLILDERVLHGNGLLQKVKKIAAGAKNKGTFLLYQSIWAEGLVQQIEYILKLVRESNIKNKDHVYHLLNIGSDFDGMINPIDGFAFSEDFENLEDILIQKLELRVVANPYLKEINVKEFVDGIMYKNALRFLKDNYKKR